MRLDDDDDDDFDEKIKKDYCMIDLNSMITLPDGGWVVTTTTYQMFIR